MLRIGECVTYSVGLKDDETNLLSVGIVVLKNAYDGNCSILGNILGMPKNER